MGEWHPIETAPQDTTVIAYGRAGQRFMRLVGGQWRNMMGAPKQAPSHWMPAPRPPGADESLPPALVDQIRCVKREIAMRESVYPRWVSDKRMTQEKAEAELAAMRAVLKTLEGIADA